MAVVLVVDDHPGMAVAVAAMARCAGFDAAVAHSGREALAYICGHPVDFVVLDVSMPGMSGLDVLRALRSGGAYRDPPPVGMFSADESARDESMRLGAVGFVCKSDGGTLLPLIERHARPGPVAR
jgi:CheY-like chemotaxis protein